jgi:uncharacterized protein involved in exopolysaccharide biosynthesis
MLPNSQPPTAPEIALLQSRMILGKTVNDLNLQADVKEKHFPLIGRALSRVLEKHQVKLVLIEYICHQLMMAILKCF